MAEGFFFYYPIFPQKRGSAPKAPRYEKFREFLAMAAKISNSPHKTRLKQ
jgi:hypothetical protein